MRRINLTYDGSIPNLINDLLVAEMWSNLAKRLSSSIMPRACYDYDLIDYKCL